MEDPINRQHYCVLKQTARIIIPYRFRINSRAVDVGCAAPMRTTIDSSSDPICAHLSATKLRQFQMKEREKKKEQEQEEQEEEGRKAQASKTSEPIRERGNSSARVGWGGVGWRGGGGGTK